MNKYATMLRQQWESADPRLVQNLSDPQEHFFQMGEQVQNEVLELLPSLEGTDPAGETYLQKVGRLNATRLQAEEIVLTEYQPPSDSSDPTEIEDPDNWASQGEQETWIRTTFQNDPEEMQDRIERAARNWQWRDLMSLSQTASSDDSQDRLVRPLSRSSPIARTS